MPADADKSQAEFTRYSLKSKKSKPNLKRGSSKKQPKKDQAEQSD